jgi:hypothetical protein
VVTESDPLDTVNSLVEKTLDPLVHKGYISLANRKYLVVSMQTPIRKILLVA